MPYFLFDPEAIKAANDAQAVLNADVTQENREKFYEAWRRLRNPYFEAALARFKAGDTTTLEVLVTFLEEDPVFHGSGYDKEYILQKIRPEHLDKKLKARLQSVCVRAADTCDRREYRRYCRLAARIADLEMVDRLEERFNNGSKPVKRRAYWMLYSIAAHGPLGLVELV